jgi:ketosteroid isomerase-like protein
MLRTTPPRLAACALALLAALAGAAAASCAGETPDAVLRCFSEAYSNRDADLLDEVMADDYVWIAVSAPEVDVFDRETSFDASVRMFRDEQVESVSLEFDDGYSVREGGEEGTWRIEDLRARLVVKSAGQATPNAATLCVTFYVREVEGDDPGFEVYREVFFEGNGCTGK